MFRLTPCISLTKLASDTIKRSSPDIRPVRWRKPIHLGTAKSKLFRVPKRPEIPEDEKEELKRLYNKYRTEMKSLRQYLAGKYQTLNETNEDPETLRKVFAEDFARCSEINDKWNAEVKVQREKRVNEQLEGDLSYAMERIELEKIKQQKTSEILEEIVRKEKEIADTFITESNIDEAIEFALSNEVDYNFAINMNGDKIMGRHGKAKEDLQKISVRQ